MVKAHSGHMATADQVAQAIERAVEKTNMPKGVFNMVYGNGVGETLKHPLIQAVGFTGSLKGGRALCDMAAARPQPIPVFAEMSSINPMLMLPAALKKSWFADCTGFGRFGSHGLWSVLYQSRSDSRN